ncbi:hypothetical protein P280DRAFT_192898 [Massarina eburnea CBS 473.64]|uniref:Uncharacterized protein n=1 Tax=Massarina eburnea CBS 473.64 TaxID=1395130 RepID=A0A6A6RIX8_9PLEO|nr:hypothetical protein P280DRAFT_192898 [Massarina eburnea CBS 473.64]
MQHLTRKRGLVGRTISGRANVRCCGDWRNGSVEDAGLGNPGCNTMLESGEVSDGGWWAREGLGLRRENGVNNGSMYIRSGEMGRGSESLCSRLEGFSFLEPRREGIVPYPP